MNAGLSIPRCRASRARFPGAWAVSRTAMWSSVLRTIIQTRIRLPGPRETGVESLEAAAAARVGSRRPREAGRNAANALSVLPDRNVAGAMTWLPSVRLARCGNLSPAAIPFPRLTAPRRRPRPNRRRKVLLPYTGGLIYKQKDGGETLHLLFLLEKQPAALPKETPCPLSLPAMERSETLIKILKSRKPSGRCGRSVCRL